mgnify:CR=1 FL=1
MSTASQRHKLQVHGSDSLGYRTVRKTTAIADQTWTDSVAISAIDASTGWSATPGTGEAWALEGAPSGVTINASTGSITGTPSGTGTYRMRVSVSDNASGGINCFSNYFTATVS